MEQTIKVVTEKQVEPAKPKTLSETNINVQAYLLLSVLCAICAWAAVEVLKEWIKARMKVKGVSKPWYYLVLVRGCAVALGGLFGWFLADSFGAGAPVAIMVGCAGGGLSSVIVKVVKAKLNKAAEK